MGEPDLVGLPFGPAELSQDVAEHGHRAVAGLVCGLHARLMDFVAQKGEVAVHREIRAGAAHHQMREAHEAAQRRFHVRRVLDQEAQQSEGRQVSCLPDQQSEVLAPGPGHAVTEQPSPSG